MSFVERLIDVTFTLASGTFAESGTNTVKLSGLRVSAKIVKAGGNAMGTAQIDVYGMTLSMMNKLSTLGMKVILVPRNTVTLEAGDSQNGMAVVFQGTITNAYANFDNSPDVSLYVEAHTGLTEATQFIPPTSFQGGVDAALVMSGFAAQMGRAFVNNGVSVQLSNPHYYGSVRDQAKACAEEAGINWSLDDPLKLEIWPRDGSRGGSVPLISPDTGMDGYPAYTPNGIMVKTLFNPSIGLGGQINVQSMLTPACGTWTVYMLDHDLDSKVPDGNWFTRVSGINPSFPAPVSK